MLEAYYNINRLCINSDKTALIVFKSDKEEEYVIKTKDDNKITPVKSHKILGWTMTKNLNMEKQLENTIRNANMKIHKMREFLKYMSISTKRKLFSCHIMSTLWYGIAQYAGETNHTKTRLHNSIMRCMRVFRGFNLTRNSNKDVLTDMGCEDPRQIVMKEAAKYVTE